MFNKVHFSSVTNHWSTPKEVYDVLNSEFNFDFDPCPLHGSQGLDIPWGRSNFVNLPYSLLSNDVKFSVYFSQIAVISGEIVIVIVCIIFAFLLGFIIGRLIERKNS